VELVAREAQAVAATGIDIVQIDDPALTYFCDLDLLAGKTHDERLLRDWSIEKDLPEALRAIQRVTDGLPCETHLHCCHSVYRRRSDVRGNYRPLLRGFRDLRVDRVNLEFAYPDTGDVGDLELLPSHLCLGMGVVDVRGAVIPDVEQIVQLASAGLKILPASRVALNPDCGFAPDAGEPPTLDEAYEKLCRLVSAARRLREQAARSQGTALDAHPIPAS
jgi:5-methyltetrahydropteroyltriglutamate--homocysteine methyltransferase